MWARDGRSSCPCGGRRSLPDLLGRKTHTTTGAWLGLGWAGLFTRLVEFALPWPWLVLE